MSKSAYVQFVEESNRIAAVRKVLDAATIVVVEWQVRGDGKVSNRIADALIESVTELRAVHSPSVTDKEET